MIQASAGRFPFSSFGGTCPFWNIHAAFEAPDRVQTQVISMPDGARYFSIGRITLEQVEDYARRTKMSVEEVERWLAPSLGYDPKETAAKSA